MIKRPTRVTDRTQTLIDVILTNIPDNFKLSGEFDPGLSDHYMTFGLMNTRIKQHKRRVITFRSKKNLNHEELKKDIEAMPWQVMETFDSVEDKCHFWHKLVGPIIDKHLPVKRMRVREKDVPYMTLEWKKAIRKKRRYAKQYAREKNEENKELRNKWRNSATRERRLAIKAYWEKLSEELKSKPREFFNAFRPFIQTKTKASGTGAIRLKINNDIISDQKVVSNHLVNYFAEMGHIDKIQRGEMQSLGAHPSVIAIKENVNVSCEFNFSLMSQQSVKEALSLLDPKKATGCDGITSEFLKMNAEQLAPSLSSLYNSCITQGKWPSEWKKGEWAPVHKKADKDLDENYRPITVLNAVDKVFEKELRKQVTDSLDSKLSPCLTAYKKHNSTETTLLRLIEDWKLAFDKGEITAILSTDMSKAFDSMVPSLLLKKLESYGLSKGSLRLIASYFEERQNRVKLGSIRSEWKETTRGCPQGSAFGPMMWNFFQNDLVFNIKHCQISMYADDHQIYYSGENGNEVELRLNQDIKMASKWYKENHLKANKDKYQAIVLQNKKKSNVEIKVMADECNEAEQTRCLKLLGVEVDDELTFSTHIGNLCKRVSQRIGVISRFRNIMPTNAKLTIYKTAVLSHLTYCSTVWHFCKVADKRKIERLQEKALRVVYCDKSTPYAQLLIKANLPSLENRRLQDIAILMYKVKNGSAPQPIKDMFTIKETHYELRNNNFIIPKFCTVKYGKNSIRYFGPYLWSRLEKKLKESPTMNHFKRNIRGMDIETLLDRRL